MSKKILYGSLASVLLLENKTPTSFILLFYQGCLFSEQPEKTKYLPLKCQSTRKLTGCYKSYVFPKLGGSPCNSPSCVCRCYQALFTFPGGQRIQRTTTNPNSPTKVIVVNNKQFSVYDLGSSYFLITSVVG